MIKSLKLKNFQSHKLTKLNFDKGVNVIIGSSDSGKSSIIRAINWIVNNKPSGDAFKSHWSKKVFAKLSFKDVVVVRAKGKGNIYKIGDDTYNSFGQSVPEDVQRVINFNDSNIQYQMDNPFLLSLSPGETARYVNKVVDLDVIDIGLKNISSTLRKEREQLVFNQASFEVKSKQLDQYSWLKEAEGKLAGYEQLQGDILRKYSDKKIIGDCIEKIAFIKREQSNLESKINSRKLCDQLLVCLLSIKKSKEKMDKLGRINLAVDRVMVWIDQEKQKAKHITVVNKLIKRNEKISKKKKEQTELSILIQHTEKVKVKIKWQERLIKDNKKLFDKLMPDICPLCGRE